MHSPQAYQLKHLIWGTHCILVCKTSANQTLQADVRAEVRGEKSCAANRTCSLLASPGLERWARCPGLSLDMAIPAATPDQKGRERTVKGLSRHVNSMWLHSVAHHVAESHTYAPH